MYLITTLLLAMMRWSSETLNVVSLSFSVNVTEFFSTKDTNYKNVQLKATNGWLKALAPSPKCPLPMAARTSSNGLEVMTAHSFQTTLL